MQYVTKAIKNNVLAVVIVLCLVLLPFFWIERGRVDLGGDASRVYFVDPVASIENLSLYGVSHGLGGVRPDYYNIPVFLFIAGIKVFLQDPGVVSSFFNSLKLSVGFLTIYLIIGELANVKGFLPRSKKIAGIIAGLLYVFFQPLINNYDRSLLVHNEIFLSPLMFYLVLRYFNSSRILYLLAGILVSIIFSINFSWAAAPFTGAFYSMLVFFIVVYIVANKKKIPKIRYKEIILLILLYLGAHSFHLLPTLSTVIGGGFGVSIGKSGSTSQVLDYFTGILPGVSPAGNLVASLTPTTSNFSYFLIPFVIVSAFFYRPKQFKTFLIVGGVFLLCFYLVTAKIGDTGVTLYKWFFTIPGFSMFRDFLGKWYVVYAFYYTIFFGLALVIIFTKLKKIWATIIAICFALGILIHGFPLWSGNAVNKPLFEAANLSPVMKFPDEYVELASFIDNLPSDQKLLFLPLTDFDYQVFQDNQGGAYLGSSPIRSLTNKKDFSGYTHLGPFADVVYEKINVRDFNSLETLFRYLNIGYIILNKDADLYEKKIKGYPYTYAKEYQPKNVEEYKHFLDEFNARVVYNSSKYIVYSLRQQLPHIWIAGNVNISNTEKDIIDRDIFKNNDTTVTLSREFCKLEHPALCHQIASIPFFATPSVTFQKVNPTLYKISLERFNAPVILSFSESFSKSWTLIESPISFRLPRGSVEYFSGNVAESPHTNSIFNTYLFQVLSGNSIGENGHFLSNGYANSWLLFPDNSPGDETREMYLEMKEQRIFYIGSAISLLSIVIIVILSSAIIFRKGNHG